MDVRAGARRRTAGRCFRGHRRNTERHAAVQQVGPGLRAAARTAAPAYAQQQRDPAGDQSPCRAGRLRRAAPPPDRHLRGHQRARRCGLLPDGADRRLQRRRRAAAAARGRSRRAVPDGAVDGRRAGQAGCRRPRRCWSGRFRQTGRLPGTPSAALAFGAGVLSASTRTTRARRSPGSSRSRGGWTNTGRRTGCRASCTATTTPPT